MTESVQNSLESLRAAIDQLSDERSLTGAASRTARNGYRGNGELSSIPAGATVEDDRGWIDLDENLHTTVHGKRVLLVGRWAGHRAFAFAARGAEYVLACGRSDAIPQDECPESMDRSRVSFRQLDWVSLDRVKYGTFDIVYCDGLLHRVLEPLTLLRTLRSMITTGGTLLIGSMLLGDPERSECLRFVPDGYAGDPTWWFIPGRLAFRWLLETAGFEVKAEFGEREGPRDGFPVVSGYLRAVAGEQ